MYVFPYTKSLLGKYYLEGKNLYTVTSTRVKYLLFPILLGIKMHGAKVRPATDRCYPQKEYVVQLPGA